MTTERVRVIVEFDVDDVTSASRSELMREEFERYTVNNWSGKNHKVTIEVEQVKTSSKSGVSGHLINVVEVDGGHLPKCICGSWWGLDGYQGFKPYKSQALAQRVGDLHIFYVKKELESK
jgi:hypothetical protein